MKLLYEWGISSVGFLIWIVLSLVIIPIFTRYLSRKADQTQRMFDKILSSAIYTSLASDLAYRAAMRSQNTLF
jgi:hypothetical protein